MRAAAPHGVVMAKISSPCIKVCLIDHESGICGGCGRTLDEIGRWSLMSEAERRAIMTLLARRLAPDGAEPDEDPNQA